MTSKTKTTGNPVLVTTEHRGVFFGYADPADLTAWKNGKAPTLDLKRMRNCIQWRGLHGFLALTTEGPSAACKIGPAASGGTPAQRDRLAELLASGATIAFWKSDAAGGASNGGSCAPVQPGTIHEERGPLREDCGRGQLHATLLPPKWNGERMWIVAFHGEVRHGDDKLWGLKREILGECL